MEKKTFEQLRERNFELATKMEQLNSQASLSDEQNAEYVKMEREVKANNLAMQQIEITEKREAMKTPEKQSLMKKIREAMKNNERSITVQGYTNAQSQSVSGVHNHVVEEDIQGILEPLYTNSVLGKLGCRFYPGLVQGDVKVPVMGKNSVGWESEIGSASETGNTFSSVTLKPKRLTAYVDISKQLLLQDTIGVEASVKRDLVKAVADKLEATVFGYAQGTTTQPGGMFYNQTLADASSFEEIVEIEGELEDACVNPANCKYLLSPKAKATLRTMATNGDGSPRVLENGDIDGTPVVTSANVIDAASTTAGAYIYGDWSNLAVGSWGDVEIGIYEDSRTAVAGVVRLVVNAYFDIQVLRAAAFKYGDVRHA